MIFVPEACHGLRLFNICPNDKQRAQDLRGLTKTTITEYPHFDKNGSHGSLLSQNRSAGLEIGCARVRRNETVVPTRG